MGNLNLLRNKLSRNKLSRNNPEGSGLPDPEERKKDMSKRRDCEELLAWIEDGGVITWSDKFGLEQTDNEEEMANLAAERRKEGDEGNDDRILLDICRNALNSFCTRYGLKDLAGIDEDWNTAPELPEAIERLLLEDTDGISFKIYPGNFIINFKDVWEEFAYDNMREFRYENNLADIYEKIENDMNDIGHHDFHLTREQKDYIEEHMGFFIRQHSMIVFED
jgi:hypothetical protein